MAYNFPDSPTEGQEYSPTVGITYVYQAPRWVVKFTESGMEEAPTDGEIYGRQLTEWVEIPEAPVEEAPSDGEIYGRQDTDWVVIPEVTVDVDKAYVDAADALKVNKAGDTLTGNLTISKSAPSLILDRPGGSSQVLGKKNGLDRWSMYLGDGTPESGADVGSDFRIYRVNDAGVTFNAALTIERKTGYVFLEKDPTDPLGVATKQYVDAHAGGGGPVAASDVSFFPLGTIASTDVQSAIVEVNGEKLSTTGGSLTGDLTINKDSPAFTLNKPAGNFSSTIYGTRAGINRWRLNLGSNASESGGNAGSNFLINYHADDGASLGTALSIERATGAVTINGSLSLGGSLTFKPPTSLTPGNVGELTFEATSNTSLTIKFRGSDNVVRSAVLTLA